MLHAKQIRAARAILGWGKQKTADRCGLSLSTIRNLEDGLVEGRSPTYRVIRGVFEDNGVEFTEMEGVRMRPRGLSVFEGTDAPERFFDHVIKTIHELGGEVLAIGPTVAMMLDSFGLTVSMTERLQRLTDVALMKCLVLESETAPALGEGVQFRSVSRLQTWPAPYFIYGDRVCFSVLDGGIEFRLIVLQSALQAKEWSGHFLKLWDAAPPLTQRGIERVGRLLR